jgi:hypothetical protein
MVKEDKIVTKKSDKCNMPQTNLHEQFPSNQTKGEQIYTKKENLKTQ